jgi:hypothetical protein
VGTLISDELRWAADQIVHHLDYRSAVLSGLAPDNSHLSRGGFHCSVLDLRAHGNAGDYSNVRANDKDLNVEYGAALDVSLTKADMIRAYGRIHTVWADRGDPRRTYINAINCWDGSGDAVRLDFDANTAKYASEDHQWHTHSEVHRRYVRDMTAMRALVSIYAGQPKTAWTTTQTGDLVTTQIEFNALMDTWWNDRMQAPAAGKAPSTALINLRVAPWQQQVGRTGVSAHDTLFGTMQVLLRKAANEENTDPAAVAQLVLAGLNAPQLATTIAQAVAQAVPALDPQQLAQAIAADLSTDQAQALLAALRDLLNAATGTGSPGQA